MYENDVCEDSNSAADATANADADADATATATADGEDGVNDDQKEIDSELRRMMRLVKADRIWARNNREAMMQLCDEASYEAFVMHQLQC